MYRSIFAGTFGSRGVAHPRDERVALLMWDGLQEMNSLLDRFFHDSGLATFCQQLSDLCIYLSRDGEFGVDAGRSCFESKRVYNAFVHVDVRGYRNGFDRKERFWRELRVCLEAFLHVAEVFSASSETIDYLQREIDALPASPPWPLIPEVKPYESEIQSADTRRDPDLSDEPGVLWITTSVNEDADIQRVFSQLTAFVHEEGLGEWDGDSRGGGEADISFEVSSLRDASKRILAFLKLRWPDLEFAITDQPSDALGV